MVDDSCFHMGAFSYETARFLYASAKVLMKKQGDARVAALYFQECSDICESLADSKNNSLAQSLRCRSRHHLARSLLFQGQCQEAADVFLEILQSTYIHVDEKCRISKRIKAYPYFFQQPDIFNFGFEFPRRKLRVLACVMQTCKLMSSRNLATMMLKTALARGSGSTTVKAALLFAVERLNASTVPTN